MKQRLEYIDTARGIAIFLVITGHSIGDINEPINQLILSFHMPLFFIISGIFLCTKNTDMSFLDYLKKQIHHLLIPHTVLSAFEYLYVTLNDFKHLHTLAHSTDFIEIFMHSWFLIVLFEISIISFYLKKLVKHNYIIWGIAILCLGGSYLVQTLPERGNFFWAKLNILPTALLFYLIGHLLKRRWISETKYGYINLYILLCTVFLSQLNSPVKMYANDYGSLPLFICTSLLGSYFILQVALKLRSTFFIWLGKMSIVVYIFQQHISIYSRSTIKIIAEKAFGTIDTAYLYPCNIILTLSIVLILTYMVYCHKTLCKILGVTFYKT